MTRVCSQVEQRPLSDRGETLKDVEWTANESSRPGQAHAHLVCEHSCDILLFVELDSHPFR